MNKAIKAFSSTVKQYMQNVNIGALFLDCVKPEFNQRNKHADIKTSIIDKTIASGKDCYFLVDQNDCNYDPINASFYTLNGISSLLYFDQSVEEVLTTYENNTHARLVLVTPSKEYTKRSLPFGILYSSILFLEEDFLDKYRNNPCITDKITLLNNELLLHYHLEKQRLIIIVDPAAGTDYVEIASCLYMCNASNIVIASSKLQAAEQSNAIWGSQLLLADSQAENPHPDSVYRQKDNILSNGFVTVVINLFKRYDAVLEIYNQLIIQSYPVSIIYVWVNSVYDNERLELLRRSMPRARFIVSDDNIGVWARFAFALNICTEFTVIFDDDTIPGVRWVENCISTFQNKPALLGTVGLVYGSQHEYMNHQRFGWPSANSIAKIVDIVGHSWFFKTEWLKYYWSAKEDICGLDFCGEDMHFSYALQQHGIPTIVPPHPASDRSMWGSLKAIEHGTGEEAISVSGKGSHMNIPLQRLVARGFVLQKFPTPKSPG